MDKKKTTGGAVGLDSEAYSIIDFAASQSGLGKGSIVSSIVKQAKAQGWRTTVPKVEVIRTTKEVPVTL